MTIEELLQNLPNLTKADDKHIWILPHSGGGYTLFPVGEKKELKSAVEPTKENPTGTLAEFGFVPFDGAIKITADEYIGITNGSMVFTKDLKRVIPYVPTFNESKLKETRKAYEAAIQTKMSSQAWLSEHDYIGVKISEALLVNDATRLNELRTQYASVIAEAQTHRNKVNTSETAIKNLEAEIKKLEEVIENEN